MSVGTTAAIAIGAGAIGAGTSIAGGIMGSNAANKAAATQTAYGNSAALLTGQEEANGLDTLAGARNQAYANQQPYIDGGAISFGQQLAGVAPGGQFSAGNAPQLNLPNSIYVSPYAFHTGATAIDDPYAVTNSPYATQAQNTNFQFNPATLQQDPSYQFRFNQGEQALSAGLNANGVAGGNAGVALQNYGQQAASQEYANAYARAQGTFQQNFADTAQQGQQNFSNQLNQNQQNYGNTFQLGQQNFQNAFNQQQQNFSNDQSAAQANYDRTVNNATLGFNAAQTNNQNLWSRLSGLTGYGQNAVNTFSNTDANYANNAANLRLEGALARGNDWMGVGNAQAAGTIGSANAWSSALNGVGSSFGGALTGILNNKANKP